MMKLLVAFMICAGCGHTGHDHHDEKIIQPVIYQGCEDCELIFEGKPEVIGPHALIADAGEPGERLELNGVVMHGDRKNPAADVIVYFYHTDHKGLYSKTATETTKHGHLRGWVKTNERGEYSFSTVRPASYPGSNNPQHIHMIILEPGKDPYYGSDILFGDDPLLEGKNSTSNPEVVHVQKRDDGVWYGKRNIYLQ